jgi:uncharacterized protein Yka (UPF0111/DUF47 family)
MVLAVHIRSQEEQSMAEKSKILEVLGGKSAELLLMEKVHRALQANERTKYLLTLLQLGLTQAHVQAPDPDDLSVERRRAGIEDAELDRSISSAALTADGSLAISGSEKILALLIEETARMCVPLWIARRSEAEVFAGRLWSIAQSCRPFLDGQESQLFSGSGLSVLEGFQPPSGEEARSGNGPAARIAAPAGVLPQDLIPRLTSAERRGPDSLHLVVMDAHKALNGLIADLGGRREKIGSVETLGLTAEDKSLVEGFNRGLDSTASLKGGHPGLGTTAVRIGSKLLLQNDIGETDAHVILLEIEEGKLDLTYTDVHDKRVEFLTELLKDLEIRWRRVESRSAKDLSEGTFFLLRGMLSFKDQQHAARVLEAIGGRLVFLIDWNKARKRLRNFIRGSEVQEVLLWSARERIGHMPFLSYGDEEIVYESLEALPRGTVRLGEPLSSILGREGSLEFIRDALRLARESYDRREPRILLVDRLRCSLLARAQKLGGGADEMLLEVAGLTVEASLAFRDALRAVTRPLPGFISRSHERIARWEERADDRLNRIRKLHLKEPQPLLPVAELVDDTLDALEDACDLTRALSECFPPGSLPGELMAILEESAELNLQSSQLFLRIVHLYRRLVHGGIAEPLFSMINELKIAEQRGDEVKRLFRWKSLPSSIDHRMFQVLGELKDREEEAINALSRGGFRIHDLAYAAMENHHG